MLAAVLKTNSMAIPSNYDLVRMPPRLPEKDQQRYFSTYDFQSIFYDVFVDGDRVLAIGPPYRNLKEWLGEAAIKLDGNTIDDSSLVRWSEFDRMSRTAITLQGNLGQPTDLQLSFRDLELRSGIGSSYVTDFEGSNLLVTMNRNNPLANVRDWLELNVQMNGIDSAIIFDNRSDNYSSADLLKNLRSVPGLERLIIVEWPHPYGAVSPYWDSDYGQYAAWEVARQRFGRLSQSLMVCDVDEIILSEDGRPAYLHAQESPSGVCYFDSRELSPVTDDCVVLSEGEIRRHHHFGYYDPEARLGLPKYVVIPERLSDKQQLKVHAISGATSVQRGWASCVISEAFI
ncbi:hypothetical protein JKI95_10010 [Corynebacterium aquatimens]|uniref:hypothetical protein n=1 Tax=Corynebacterium aquatimens TaxID=1190508 RepID=UPI002541E015|nr:hypothetical protein [Corynebacterium aquatimens]QYH19418.1 hypothetical protein JKI95_10010 [Corynebacterium aquatimens]